MPATEQQNEIVKQFEAHSNAMIDQTKSNLADLQKKEIEPLQNEVKSLKEANAKLEEKLSKEIENNQKNIDKIELAINKGFASSIEKTEFKSYTPLSLKEAKTIAEAINGKMQIQITNLESKAIRFGDATSTNLIDKPATVMGSFEINKDSPSTILQDVDVLPPVNGNEGTLVWDTYDESLIEAYEANEMDQSKVTKEVVYSNRKLNLKKVQAHMNISTDVILNVLQGGSQVIVLDRNIAALNKKFDKKVIKNIFQDLVSGVNNGLIGKTASTTQYAPADATIRRDLRNFLSTLKKEYIANSVIYVSRQLINAAFSIEASDGHLPLEQFYYASNIQAFVTPEGLIPVKTFEHSQIGTYKSLHDGTTDITSDYTAVTANLSGNAGKLLAFVGDLKFAYKVIPSSIGLIGYDSNVTPLLTGATKAGKISYVAQGFVETQAVKAFYAKA